MREQYIIRLWYGTSAVVLMVVFYLAYPFAWQVAAVAMTSVLAAKVWIVPTICRRTQYLRPTPNTLRLVIWVTIVVHIIACLSQLAIRDGTEMSAQPELRGAWIADQRGLWLTAWSTWPLASASLLWFCRTWVRNFSLGLTWAAMAGYELGVVAFGRVVMALFTLWLIIIDWNLRRR